MFHQLAKRDEEALERKIAKVSGDKANGVKESENAPPACWIEFLSNYGRLAGQVLRIQTKMTENFVQILPLMGRHCRDMLSDQGMFLNIILKTASSEFYNCRQLLFPQHSFPARVFLNEIANHVLKSKNRNDEFLEKILLKFFVSGKQAREIAAAGALKLVG